MQNTFQDPWIRRRIAGTNVHYAYGREYGNPMPLIQQDNGHSFQIRETNRTAELYHDGIRDSYKARATLIEKARTEGVSQLENVLERAVDTGWLTISSKLEGHLPPEAKPIIYQTLADTMTLCASATSEYFNYMNKHGVADTNDIVLDTVDGLSRRLDADVEYMWSNVNT